MKKVENCLYYPDILTQFVKRNPSNPLNPNKYNDYTLPIWTAERFANDEHCTKNVKIFAELAGAVKESLNKNKQNLQDYDKAASFFKEQDMIEQKYQDALHEQALAKQEYDFAIKARDERYKRQQEQQVKVYGEEWA